MGDMVSSWEIGCIIPLSVCVIYGGRLVAGGQLSKGPTLVPYLSTPTHPEEHDADQGGGGEDGGNSDSDSTSDSSDTSSDCTDTLDTDDPDVEIQCVQLHETLSHLSLYGMLAPFLPHLQVRA